MALTPRCWLSGNSAQTNATTFSPALTGWTNAGLGVSGTAPATGDIVVVAGFELGTSSQTWSQSAGTGTWTFHSTGTLNATSGGVRSMAASRVFDGTETAPTFTSTSSNRIHWVAIAVAPDAGSTVSIDVWATDLVQSTAGTTRTPNSATAAGTGEVSVILNGVTAAATGATAITFTDSSGWTTGPSNNVAGSGSSFSYYSDAIFKTGVGSGSVAPGAETDNVSAVANVYHVLLAETAPPAAAPPQMVPPGLRSPASIRLHFPGEQPQFAAPAAAVSAPAGVATSTVVAPAPTAAVTAAAGVAASTAVAPAPTPAVAANAGVAAVSAVAVSPSATETATAAVATVQAVAVPPVPAVTANAGVATVQAAAPAAGHAATATTGVATSQATAPAPTPAITANAGVGIVGVVAPQPVVNTSGSTNAPAQVAPVQAAAASPTVAVQASAGVAAVLAAAPAPSLALTATAQAARTLAVALNAAGVAGGAVAVARSTPTVADPRDGTATVTQQVT